MEDLNYEENGNVFPILRRKHASFLRRLTETSRTTYGNCCVIMKENWSYAYKSCCDFER